MRELVYPAIASLARQIDKGEFPATRYVLDWAGFSAAEHTPTDSSPVHVTVIFDRADQTIDQPPTLALNGHTAAD